MGLLIVVTTLFSLSGIWNLISTEGDPANAIAAFSIAAVAGAYLLISAVQEARQQGLLTWLLENAEQIEAGQAELDGIRIAPETRIRQFDTAISLLIVSLRIPTRWYLEGVDRPFLSGLCATFGSLSMGWWGIPWGPIMTLQSLFTNLSGGRTQTVGWLLDETREAIRRQQAEEMALASTA